MVDPEDEIRDRKLVRKALGYDDPVSESAEMFRWDLDNQSGGPLFVEPSGLSREEALAQLIKTMESHFKKPPPASRSDS